MCVGECGCKVGGCSWAMVPSPYHAFISPSPDPQIRRVTAGCWLADCQVRGGQLGGVSLQFSHLLADRGTDPARCSVSGSCLSWVSSACREEGLERAMILDARATNTLLKIPTPC